MKTIELFYDRDHLESVLSLEDRTAQVFSAWVYYVYEAGDRVAVLFSRSNPGWKQPSLSEQYLCTFNGEPCSFGEPVPVRVRGVWFEHDTDLTPKYVLVHPASVQVDGKECFAFFDPAEFTAAELFQQEEIPFSGIYKPYQETVPALHKTASRAFRCADGHAFEAVDYICDLGDGVAISKVRRLGADLTDPKGEKRWWLCRYPAGEWETAKHAILGANPALKGAKWRKIAVTRVFDRAYSIPEGSEFKLVRAE